MSDPSEVAAALSDRRNSTVVMDGWSRNSNEMLLNLQVERQHACPEGTRTMCVKMGGCLEEWLARRRKDCASISDPAALPEETSAMEVAFRKCRKVVVRFIMTVEEDWGCEPKPGR